VILTLVGCACFAFAGWNLRAALSHIRHRRHKRQLLEVNRFSDGLVLPAVDDPRWEKKNGPCASTRACPRYNMVIGNIRCCMDHGVIVSDMGLEETWPEEADQLLFYAQEVRRQTLDRMVQESIESAAHPQLEA